MPFSEGQLYVPMPDAGVVVAVAAGAELVTVVEVTELWMELLLDEAVDVLDDPIVEAASPVVVGDVSLDDLFAREPPTPPPTAAAIMMTSITASNMKNVLRRKPQYRLSFLPRGEIGAAALCFSLKKYPGSRSWGSACLSLYGTYCMPSS